MSDGTVIAAKHEDIEDSSASYNGKMASLWRRNFSAR